MSFLNSILASVENDGPPPSLSSGVAASQAKSTNSRVPTQGSSRSSIPQTPTLKRKPEVPPAGSSAAKLPRPTLPSSPGGIKNCTAQTSLPQTATLSSKANLASTGARPGGLQIPAKANARAETSAARPPPKKGSYKEIMARAQAAKEAQADFGKIKHKKVARLTKRERAAYEAAAARSKGKVAGGRLAGMGKKMDTSLVNVKSAQDLREKKKRAELTYQGTARANGPSKVKKATKSASTPSRYSAKTSSKFRESDEDDGDTGYSRRYKYAGSSQEEEEDYKSDDDGSEDVGGGGFAELEEEEQRSLRVAQREDAEALRQENELKRAKLERKSKLKQLAAKANRPRF